GNEMRVVAAAAGQQLRAQTRILVHFQHVYADVRYARSQRLSDRKAPALLRLVRQSGNQVNADVGDAASTQARYVVQSDGPRVQSSYGRALFVHERLNAQADTIHAATEQRFEDLGSDGTGRAFHGNFGCTLNVEGGPNRAK